MKLQFKTGAREFTDKDGVNRSFTDEGLLKIDIILHARFRRRPISL
jgi:hypothetical protein